MTRCSTAFLHARSRHQAIHTHAQISLFGEHFPMTRSRASEPKLRQEKTRITLFDPSARGGRGAHDLRSPVEGAHPVVVCDADVCPEFLNHHTHRVRVVIGARGV